MSSLYHKTAQMLVNWSGEDASERTSASDLGRHIVDMLIHEIHEHGMPSLDHLADVGISEHLDDVLDGPAMRRAG